MRIAFYVHGFPYFHNTFIHTEVTALVRRGHDVRLVACFNPSPHKVNSTSAGLEGRVRYLSPAERALLEPLWTAPDVDEAWSALDDGRRRSLRDLPVVRELADADVVHAAFADGSATVAWLLGKLIGRPFTFEAHAYDLFVEFPHARVKVRDAAAIFPATEYNRRHLIDAHGCAGSRLIVKRPTFDAAAADALAGTPRDPDLVVSVCRLHPIKGLPVALEAVARVAAERPGLRYTIIGDGPIRPALEEQAAALGLDGVVRFTGDLTNAEALGWTARASVLLLPSVLAPDGDRDGIPTALYEAMYLGTPVVTSRVSGIPELVRHQECGWLAEPGDVGGVADGLRWFLEDDELREAFGARGRARVLEMFDVERNMDRLEQGLAAAARVEAARA